MSSQITKCRAKRHFARTKQSLRSTTLKLLNVKQDACDTMLENLQKIRFSEDE